MNLSEEDLCRRIGSEIVGQVKEASLRLFKEASLIAESRGIIIADTKFEFGMDKNGELLLADECLTPDSTRFYMSILLILFIPKDFGY